MIFRECTANGMNSMADIQWLDANVDREAAAPRGKPCEACGTPIEPLDKFCPACGTTNPDFHLPATAATAARQTPEVVDAEVIEKEPPAQKHFRCETCGA